MWNSPEPKNTQEARAIQMQLRDLVKRYDAFSPLKFIVGVDVGYDRQQNLARASLVVMDYSTLEPVEQVLAHRPVSFPYVPGLLSFREAPVVLDALDKLQIKPDLLMVDGQGIAHPRRMGIAAHLGVITDLPAIGVAKSRLTGTYQEPGQEKGNQTPLLDKGEQIGVVLRSRHHVRPLFISPGHRVGIQNAVKIVQHCLTRYRLPEPTRLADKYSKFSMQEIA